MKKSCLYFDKKKYKCVPIIVHYKGLTLRKNPINTPYVNPFHLLPPGAVPIAAVWSQQGGGSTAPQDAGCPRYRYVAGQGGFH